MNNFSRQLLLCALVFCGCASAKAVVIRVENVVFQKPANYDTMTRREQILSFVMAQRALVGNQAMNVPRFLLKPGQNGDDLDKEIGAVENELAVAENKVRAERFLRELGPRLEATKNRDKRSELLNSLERPLQINGQTSEVSEEQRIAFFKFWLGKSRDRDLREQLIAYLELKTIIPEVLSFAEELTKEDLPKIPTKIGREMFPYENPNINLTRGYWLLKSVLEIEPTNPKLQELLGLWLEKAATAEPMDFYDRLSPQNLRIAQKRLATTISRPVSEDRYDEIDTHTFLVLCRLSGRLRPQSVEEATQTLARIKRTDLSTIEKISVAEVAQAMGTLQAEGTKSESAIPTLLQVLGAKSDDYWIVVLSTSLESRKNKVLGRLSVFRLGAIQTLSDINLNGHPEAFDAIVSSFQRKTEMRINFREQKAYKPQIEVFSLVFSRVDGSNRAMIPVIARLLEYEFNGRQYQEKYKLPKNRTPWRQLYDAAITHNLFSVAARFRSGAPEVLPYVLFFLKRGESLKPFGASSPAPLAEILLSTPIDDPARIKQLLDLLLRASQQNQKPNVEVREKLSVVDSQIVLLEVLSRSPESRKMFTVAPYNSMFPAGWKKRFSSLKQTSANLQKQLPRPTHF